jgi:hypothetical protein
MELAFARLAAQHVVEGVIHLVTCCFNLRTLILCRLVFDAKFVVAERCHILPLALISMDIRTSRMLETATPNL